MRNTYQWKLTLSFLIIFTLFTIGIVLIGQYQARRYKTEALEERLDAYAGLVRAFVHGSPEAMAHPDSLLELLPAHLRLTCIAYDGRVLYDNLIPDASALENHAARPEIRMALERGRGSQIRTSSTNSIPYLYYARYYGDGFIRVAMPYDIQVQHFLKPENGYLYFIIGLFIAGLLLIHMAGNHFGKSIRRLRDFSASVSAGSADIEVPDFPKDELGEIGEQITLDYRKLKESESRISLEREKLLQHIQTSAEGVCFFQPDHTVAFYNGLFLQYLNAISGGTDSREVLSVEAFRPVREFLLSEERESYFEMLLGAGGREFQLWLNRFEDGSFEVVLHDITGREKTRRLKREMTGNIAHELRTPVTSIRGFLETVLDSPLTPEQQRNFLEKAYRQTLNLSELIRDMGLLTKIEESPDHFDVVPVDLQALFDRVVVEFRGELKEHRIGVDNRLSVGELVTGNESLLYSVFRNLLDNAVRHAGDGVSVVVKEIGRQEGFVYVSFADTGCGVTDSTHLARLFERFYRVDEGRTRDGGGSGLGLSIVKNAVRLHGGTIQVANVKGGGLEFVLSLPVA